MNIQKTILLSVLLLCGCDCKPVKEPTPAEHSILVLPPDVEKRIADKSEAIRNLQYEVSKVKERLTSLEMWRGETDEGIKEMAGRLRGGIENLNDGMRDVNEQTAYLRKQIKWLQEDVPTAKPPAKPPAPPKPCPGGKK